MDRSRWIVVLAAGGAVLALAVVAALRGFAGEEAMPAFPETAEEGLHVLSSPQFERLPDYRQEAYRSEVQRLVAALPEQERMRLFERFRTDEEMRRGLRALRMNPMHEALETYYGAPPDERRAVVDGFIDRMEQWRRLRETTGGPGGPVRPGAPRAGGPPPEQQSAFRDRMERRFQEGNPLETARIMEFWKHVRQRREERGLPSAF